MVYRRSGLTYQAGLLEKAGLIVRAPSPDDERAIIVTITDEGRRRLARVRDHMRSTPPRSAAPRRRKGET